VPQSIAADSPGSSRHSNLQSKDEALIIMKIVSDTGNT